MNDPEPMDDKEAPEIRGGNRPADYMPEKFPRFHQDEPFGELMAHEDSELEDGAESYGEAAEDDE